MDWINQIYNLIETKDKELTNILDKIDNQTQCLDSEEISNKKYEAIIGIEYLLVRARVLVENEHISLKRVLAHPDTTPSVKTVLTKRDQYLAQVSLKLSTIRDDIANLQKVVYTAINFGYRK